MRSRFALIYVANRYDAFSKLRKRCPRLIVKHLSLSPLLCIMHLNTGSHRARKRQRATSVRIYTRLKWT